MNRKFAALLALICCCGKIAMAGTITVSPSGNYPNFVYVPNSFTVLAGDRVAFAANGLHPLFFETSPLAATCTTDCTFAFTNAGDTFNFYCGNHGAPGGVGMSGIFTVLPNPDLVMLSDFDISPAPNSGILLPAL